MRHAESSTCQAMWQSYLASLPEEGSQHPRHYQAWHFADNQSDANELAQLVLCGAKTATCSAYQLYELEGEPLPQVGEYSIVTDWPGNAVCVIRISTVEIQPFDQVTADFAAAEGEGDRSLRYWRETHRAFFERALSSHALTFSEQMPLVCQRFERLFPG